VFYEDAMHLNVQVRAKYNPLSCSLSREAVLTRFETIENDPRNRKSFAFQATFFRRFLVAVLRQVFRMVMKMEVIGLENLPPDGAVVIACNHVTNFDVFPMQLSLPRPIFFMAKAELFNFPLMDMALRNLGAFPVYRGEKDAWAMKHAQVVLEREQTLGMFPEGTRNKGRGLGLAKTGTARTAIDTNSPIVPMLLTGTDGFFKHFPRRANVTVKLLPPLMPATGETPLALTDRLMFSMAAALPEELRGVYAEIPKGFGD
jgi:1-acyl-sn-glycerol-3-phosphate acyltransferase